MSANKNDVESQGANPRDHDHARHHTWHPRTKWSVAAAVILMLALILVYVFTKDLALRPSGTAAQPVPANAP